MQVDRSHHEYLIESKSYPVMPSLTVNPSYLYIHLILFVFSMKMLGLSSFRDPSGIFVLTFALLPRYVRSHGPYAVCVKMIMIFAK